MADVLIFLGSPNDLAQMAKARNTLDELGISSSLHIVSAHRDPERVSELVRSAEEAGDVKVIIAGAGMAAHLAGTVAARTVLPVIGVPLSGSPLGGADALFSTDQMPSGIPVATVGIDGASNAAILAAEIIGLSRPEVQRSLQNLRLRDRDKARGESARLA